MPGAVAMATSIDPTRRRPDRAKTTGPKRAGNANDAQGAVAVVSRSGLQLPHERDESASAPASAPDPVIVQAKRDIDAGLVDTDMRATPGLDAKRRAEMVPGAGGKPPGSRK